MPNWVVDVRSSGESTRFYVEPPPHPPPTFTPLCMPSSLDPALALYNEAATRQLLLYCHTLM